MFWINSILTSLYNYNWLQAIFIQIKLHKFTQTLCNALRGMCWKLSSRVFRIIHINLNWFDDLQSLNIKYRLNAILENCWYLATNLVLKFVIWIQISFYTLKSTTSWKEVAAYCNTVNNWDHKIKVLMGNNYFIYFNT